MPFLEVACFNTESALIAEAAGADRIELCKDQQLGGTTPLLSTFQGLKTDVRIPINVMIRPRGGDFIYDAEDIHQMEMDLSRFGDAGVDGFVFGVLEGKGVDLEMCRRLVDMARGKPCTFHRAFDGLGEDHMLEQLEVLIHCGFKSVLTSGGENNAVEGSRVLRKLVRAARGRIEVIVGGGVRSINVQTLLRDTDATTFHSSAIVAGGELASREEVVALKSLLKGR